MTRRRVLRFTVTQPGLEADAYRTRTGAVVIRTNHLIAWAALVEDIRTFATAPTRRTHMHTAYRAKTRRRNRRTR